MFALGCAESKSARSSKSTKLPINLKFYLMRLFIFQVKGARPLNGILRAINIQKFCAMICGKIKKYFQFSLNEMIPLIHKC